MKYFSNSKQLITRFKAACSKMEKENEITVSGSFIVEDIDLPFDYEEGNFHSINEWLTDICKGAKPTTEIDEFSLGLFEGDEYHLSLVGRKDSVVGNDHYSKIAFEPPFMYYKLPEAEYAGLSREQIWSKITEEVKEFTSSKAFKNCFLSEAKSFTIEYSGENLIH